MRHRKQGKVLDRKVGPRTALLRGLATSIMLHEKVRTTHAKAKAVQPLVEQLITLGKKNTLDARRQLHEVLYTEGAVRKVLEVLSPRYQARRGGYTRVTKLGKRVGDGADVVQLEMV